MTIRELIDFYLAIQSPGNLLGFDNVFSQDLEALKMAIQEQYGHQNTWLDLPEDTELPKKITDMAQTLVKQYDAWNAGESGQ